MVVVPVRLAPLARLVLPALARDRVRRVGLVVLALGTGGVAFGLRYLLFRDFANDHYQHLARAQQMLLGGLPVRDFAESGLPLTAGLSALAQLLLGPGLHSELIWIGAAFALAAGLSVVAAVRTSGSLVLALVGAAVTVLAFPVSYSYPKLLPYVAAFLAMIAYAAKPGAGRMALLAVLVVAAFLLRHDHGFIIGVSVAAAMTVCHWPAREAIGQVTRFVAIGLLLVSPYLLWVQAYQGVAAYASDALALGAREAARADWGVPRLSIDPTQPILVPLVTPWRPVVTLRWAPGTLPAAREARELAHGLRRRAEDGPQTWRYELSRWATGDIERLVTDPIVADTHGIDRVEYALVRRSPGLIERMLMRVRILPGAGLLSIENGVAMVYALAWALPLAAGLGLWRGWSRLPRAVRAVVVMAAVAQVIMNRSMLRDPLSTRVRDVVQPFAVLLPFVVSSLWHVESGHFRNLARVLAVAVLAVAVGGTWRVGELQERVEEAGLLTGRWAGIRAQAADVRQGFEPPRERTGRVTEPLAEYLRDCSMPGDRLLPMTFAPEIFFASGRGFAGGHESLVPGFYTSPDQIARMLARLRHERVPFVLLDSETEDEVSSNWAPVAAYVRSRYREVARHSQRGLDGKEYIVLADARAPVARAYGERELPCFAAEG